MKYRTGFVSNSSSSSFLLALDKELTEEDKYQFLMDIIPDSVKNEVKEECLKPDSYFVKDFCKRLNLNSDCSNTWEWFDNEIKNLEDNLVSKRINYGIPIYLSDNIKFNYINNKNFNKIKHILLKEGERFPSSFKNIWKQKKKNIQKQIDKLKNKKEKLQLKIKNADYLYYIDMDYQGNGGNLYMERKDDDYEYLGLFLYNDKFTNEFNKRIVETYEG